MREELKSKIHNFGEADYPRVGKKLSLIECLRTITKDENFEFDPELSTTIKIGDRSFELIDLYCPDLKEPNACLWDESAKIYVSNGDYVVEYTFYSTSDDISNATIYRADPAGIREINGRKFIEIEFINGSEYRNQNGISLDD